MSFRVEAGRAGIEESDNPAILPYYNEPLRGLFY
jgi:hypothetical protein